MVFPSPIAVTSPEEEFTVAVPVLELDHTPPASPLVENVDVSPIHIDAGPLTVPALTFGFTVIVAVPEAVAGQPFASVTETSVYVVVVAGETEILLPLI